MYKFPGTQPGRRRYRSQWSLYWVSSVSMQVYCELLARVPVTTTPAPLFEYLVPGTKVGLNWKSVIVRRNLFDDKCHEQIPHNVHINILVDTNTKLEAKLHFFRTNLDVELAAL